jgi:hypothetical protein
MQQSVTIPANGYIKVLVNVRPGAVFSVVPGVGGHMHVEFTVVDGGHRYLWDKASVNSPTWHVVDCPMAEVYVKADVAAGVFEWRNP